MHLYDIHINKHTYRRDPKTPLSPYDSGLDNYFSHYPEVEEEGENQKFFDYVLEKFTLGTRLYLKK
jgi:hypothetical protein